MKLSFLLPKAGRFYSEILWYYIHLLVALLLSIRSQQTLATETIANMVTLRLLDKTTARASTIEANVGKTFDVAGIVTLQVTVHACLTRQLDEMFPESAAFLDIIEVKEEPIDIFRGWMFVTSPSLSAMEHPIYDIWLLACYNNSEIEVGNSLQRGKL